ncbi:MAG TPA: DUF1015 domain-containing protein [Deltaproteobacteria bacterium]|nr:DUF1015 domain-containing protein [Deltaproteobacteria bacterium]
MKIWPFRAVRPSRLRAGDVASQAYDVINGDEARKLVENNPYSFLRVEKSEINFPAAADPYADEVYESARDTLRAMIRDGVMIQDGAPCFYICRQKTADHEQSGIVGCVDTGEYEAGRIRRHEMTRKDKEDDRTRHIDCVNAQTGAALLAYRSDLEVNGLIDEIVSSRQPEYDFRADDGTTHTAWVVDDGETIERIARAFERVENLYIADGHHRVAAAVRVAGLREETGRETTENEEYRRIMAVITPHDRLRILSYNRVVRDLNGMAHEDFLAALSRDFSLELSAEPVIPEHGGIFGMCLADGWRRLVVKNDAGTDTVDSLDVSILQDRLLAPVLGIGDPRSDERIDFVGGVRGVRELARLVYSGEYAVAFSLYPTSMESLLAVSDEGRIMPPKSTWFEPKIKSGLFVHPLDGTLR